jgi:hypothetical protein
MNRKKIMNSKEHYLHGQEEEYNQLIQEIFNQIMMRF